MTTEERERLCFQACPLKQSHPSHACRMVLVQAKLLPSAALSPYTASEEGSLQALISSSHAKKYMQRNRFSL